MAYVYGYSIGLLGLGMLKSVSSEPQRTSKIRFHTAEVAGSSPASPTLLIGKFTQNSSLPASLLEPKYGRVAQIHSATRKDVIREVRCSTEYEVDVPDSRSALVKQDSSRPYDRQTLAKPTPLTKVAGTGSS